MIVINPNVLYIEYFIRLVVGIIRGDFKKTKYRLMLLLFVALLRFGSLFSRSKQGVSAVKKKVLITANVATHELALYVAAGIAAKTRFRFSFSDALV